jgi:hypothetical protein
MGWLAENIVVAGWIIAFAALWIGWSLNRLCDLVGSGPNYRPFDQMNEELAGIRRELETLQQKLERPLTST